MTGPLKEKITCANGEVELLDYSETVPVQYQEGKTGFLGMEIEVDPRVLIPRPETELLVKAAAGLVKRSFKKNPVILDLCTGSGAVALALAGILGGARILATDISEDALDVACGNIKKHGLESRIGLVCSDMFGGLGQYNGKLDLIVSNPPYVSDADYEELDAWVKAEPEIALRSGDRGMDHIKIIACEGLGFLRPGGAIAVEIGYDQKELARDLFEANGFTGINFMTDQNGFERVITGWKNG